MHKSKFQACLMFCQESDKTQHRYNHKGEREKQASGSYLSMMIADNNQSVSRQFAAAGSCHQLAELGLAHQLVKSQYYIKEEPPTLYQLMVVLKLIVIPPPPIRMFNLKN